MFALRALATLAVGTALLVGAQAPEPYWLSREKQANAANCAVDIGIAGTFLGKAGVSINAAIQTCDLPDAEAACTTAISGIVASFAYGATFISAAAAECRSTLRIVDANKVLQEACAATTSVIIATLGLLVNSGAAIKDSCPGVRPKHTEPPDGERRLLDAANKTEVYQTLMTARRKLLKSGFQVPVRPKKSKPTTLPSNGGSLPEGLPPPPPPEGGEPGGEEPAPGPVRSHSQNAACALDVGQATFLLARAGLMINYAVSDCSAENLYTGGNIQKANCIVDVGRTIGAFGYTASGIAFAVYECPDILENIDSVCAGAIANLVAGTSELMANSADTFTNCAQLGKSNQEEQNALHDEADVERRRLSPEEMTGVGATQLV